jgi:hypothetical protein
MQPGRRPRLQTLFEQIDNTLEYAFSHNDIEVAMGLVDTLADIQRTSGLALARALYKLSLRWRELGMQDDFVDEVMRRTGYSQDTVRRYIEVWTMLERVQGDAQGQLFARPMKDLVAIVQAQNEHGRFTEAQFNRIARAPDNQTLRQVLGKLTGRIADDGEENDAPVVIRIRRDGTLEALRGRKRTVLGFLRITPDDMTDTLRAEALARIKRKAGLLEE